MQPQIGRDNIQQSSYKGSVAQESSQYDLIRQTKRIVKGKNQAQRYQIARKNLFNALDYKTPRLDIYQKSVSKSVRVAYSIQTSFVWRALLILLAYLFMYAAFFGHVHPSYTLIGIQFGFLFFMFVDLVLEIYHKKFNQLRKKSNYQTRFYIRAISLILLLADQIIVLSTQSLPIRPFLILRCILPVIYDAQMRKMFYALFSCYIDIFVYLIFYTIIIILFAIIANQFIVFPPNQVYDNFTGNYGALGKAIFIMYVLTTFDAYPDNQLVAIKINIWIYAFFIVFIFLNAIFFVTIPTNILLSSVKQTRSKTIIIDQIQQQHSLIMAFITLGGDKNKTISYQTLIKFLLHVFNDEPRYVDKITEITKLIDTKVDGTIQVNQFMQLCKIIQSKSYLRPPRYKIWKTFAIAQSFIERKLGLKQIILGPKFQIIAIIFIIFSFVNCILTMYLESQVFDIIDDIIMVVIVIQIAFRLIGLGPQAYLNSFLNIIDLFVVAIGLFLELAPVDITPKNSGVIIKMFRIFRIALLIRYLTQIFNISYKSQIYAKLSKLINQIALIIPIVFKFFPLYMISFYFLGTIGVQIFWYQTDIPPKESPYSFYNQFSNFNTLLGSQFIFVQVLTEAGWSLVAFDHAYRYGSFALTMLFFVICHQIIVIIITSLLKGVCWQVYNTISEQQQNFQTIRNQNQRNYKILKKRLDDVQAVKQKIQKQKSILPDNLIARQLYEKKIDKIILQKIIMLEAKNHGNFFSHKKSKQSAQMIQSQEYPRYRGLLSDQVNSNIDMVKNTNSISPLTSQNLLRPTSAQNNISSQVNQSNDKINSNNQEYIQSIQIKHLKQQDIQRQIDELLGDIILHQKVKFTLKIYHPLIFVNFIKKKLKPITLRISDKQFDMDKDIFAEPDSIKFMVHGLHTLLQMQTEQRQRRRIVLDVMISKGVITQQRAKKMLTQKSNYDDQTKFDHDWIIRKTYLSDIDQRLINKFQTQYFSSVYGQSFKQINKVTIYPLNRTQARLNYCLNNLLRYRQISTFQFFNTLSHIQNKMSVKLLKKGSICKFVYQIDTKSQTWFTVSLNNSNQLRINFIKNGIWIYQHEMNKDEIYVARDLFNLQNFEQQQNKQQYAKHIKSLFQNFQSLAFCIEDFNSFFNPDQQNQTYDLYTFYHDVQSCKRFVKKQLSISKIMIVMLSKQQQRKQRLPYSLSDIKYDEQQILNHRKLKKRKFKLDQTENQTFKILQKLDFLNDQVSELEGLPYSYIINFLMSIRQTLSLNQKNFIYHVEKLLNQHFKASQKAANQLHTKVKRRINIPNFE